MGKNLKKEFEKFINDRMKKHETNKAEIEKWGKQTSKDLDKHEKTSQDFWKDFEQKMEKGERWIAKKESDVENLFRNFEE